VLIHLLGPAAQERSREVLLDLMALPPAAYAHVREFGEDGGSSYVITDLHFGVAELPEWLKRARTTIGRDAARAGDFTRVFQPGNVPRPDDVPTEEIAIPAAPVGAFTQLFSPKQAAAVAEGPAPMSVDEPQIVAAAHEPGKQPDISVAVEPGAFTKLFASPGAAPLASKQPDTSVAAEPGAFTKLFASPGAAPARKQPDTPVAEPGSFTKLFTSPDAPPVSAAPGEFTQMFSSPMAPPPATPLTAQAGEITTHFQRKPEPAFYSRSKPSDEHGLAAADGPAGNPAAAPSAEPGDFTRLLSAVPPKPAPLPSPATPIQSAPVEAPSTGVSDYTRVIAARLPAALPTPPASVAPAAQAIPERRRKDVRPILVFSVLAALAVLLILLAALGR